MHSVVIIFWNLKEKIKHLKVWNKFPLAKKKIKWKKMSQKSILLLFWIKFFRFNYNFDSKFSSFDNSLAFAANSAKFSWNFFEKSKSSTNLLDKKILFYPCLIVNLLFEECLKIHLHNWKEFWNLLLKFHNQIHFYFINTLFKIILYQIKVQQSITKFL